MSEAQSSHVAHVSVGINQPLIGLIRQDDGQEVVDFFATEADADTALPRFAAADALSLAGAWGDLQWEDLADGLDRIRHESPPSPPIAV